VRKDEKQTRKTKTRPGRGTKRNMKAGKINSKITCGKQKQTGKPEPKEETLG
jgi:hypothetical protein